MKKVNANELRKVEGGMKYGCACGYEWNDTPKEYIMAKVHGQFCSVCRGAKKKWGFYYLFAGVARNWKWFY